MTKTNLTLGSLFSGIGGFELGFERTGQIKTEWQVEIDAYCRRVLARHWPCVQRFSDIRECGSELYLQPNGRKHALAHVDILCGGFPCQDISNAGKRAGIDGERSGLWSEYARIIRELRPQYVVVENVAALLGRGMERVLGDLAACGYDAEGQSIRASDVGAPHRRERIWIVAYPQRSGVWEQSIFGTERGNTPEPELNSKDVADTERAERWAYAATGNERNGHDAGWQEAPSGLRERRKDVANANGGRFAMQGESSGHGGLAARCGADVAHAAKPRLEGPNIFEVGKSNDWRHDSIASGSSWWTVEPNVGRVAHGIPSRVDRLRGLGNAIIPQIAEFIGRQIILHAFPPTTCNPLPATGVPS